MRHYSKILLFFCISLLITLFACNPSDDSTSSKNPPSQKTDIVPTNTPPSSELETDYAVLSEIELAYEISTSVDEAIDNIQTAIEMLDKSAEIQAWVKASQESIARTDDMIQAYVALYAEISPESVESLLGIQVALDSITSPLDEIAALDDNDAGMVVKLVEQTQLILTSSGLKEKAQTWPSLVQSQIEERERIYAQIQPQTSQVVLHRVGAFTQVYEFLDAYQEALNDGKFSPDELSEISQIGANAQASLYSTGDPQLFDITVKIKTLANLAISGQWPQAQEGIFELQRLLPARPRP